MIKQSLTCSNHKYVELQMSYRGSHLHIQGTGASVNRDYGLAIDTKVKKLNKGTRIWLNQLQKSALLKSLAGDSPQKYFSCQARILAGKCHIQISGTIHNRSYGIALDVIDNDLYEFINLEIPNPIKENKRFKVIELSRKLKKILRKEKFNSITTKPSVLTMLPKNISAFKTKQGDLSNGHWLLKPQWITKALDIRATTIGLDSSQPDSDKLITNSTKYSAFYKHSIMNKTSFDTYKIAIYENSEGQKAGYKETYIAWLQNNIYKFSLRFGNPKDPATIMSFDQMAGYLMPVKI